MGTSDAAPVSVSYGESPTTTIAEHNSRKAAACLVCRRSKIKCERGRDGDDERCQRCLQLGAECVRPAFHVGRRKGVKNKRTGLEKALHQVEEAVRRTRSGFGTEGLEAVKAVSNLKALLGPSSGSAVGQDDSTDHTGLRETKRRRTMSMPSRVQDLSSDDGEGEGEGDGDGDGDGEGSSTPERGELSPLPESTTSHAPSHPHTIGESLAVDDAENPLQLLARASDLHVSPPTADGPLNSDASPRKARPRRKESEMSEVEKFFKLSQFTLDVSPDLDPVELGLVTEEEAESLFAFFHKHLAHTRWGLDPVLYTASFARSRSAFLFTSIMASSALFMPSGASLSRRLSNHCKHLVNKIMMERYRSVEIILALLVNVPWMFPGKHSMDDETCCYVSMATTMAIDLSLHKVIATLGSLKERQPGNLSRADCIDPKVALSLDGFGDVDPASEYGRRLLRRRERCWISLFVLERGMCLARGRSYIVPVTHTLRTCERWHISKIADTMDGHLVSMAVLRRDLDTLFASIRAICDGSQDTLVDGSVVAQSIQLMIEKFFDEWHAKWQASIGTGHLKQRLPPYVQILVTHTRLSIYSTVINHPTAPTEVWHFFHSAGLTSALNVMRVAIQGEGQLMSMPNNTAIMISFAACFALRLSGMLTGNSSLAPSVRTLIEEAADVLERIGSATPHRNGMSTLYGKYLRYIVRKAAASTVDSSTRPHALSETTMSRQQASIPQPARMNAYGIAEAMNLKQEHQQPQEQQHQQHEQQDQIASFTDPTALWSEPIQFSSMSDDQIVEALNRVSNNGFDPDSNMYSWDDAATLDWMNWSNMPGFGT